MYYLYLNKGKAMIKKSQTLELDNFRVILFELDTGITVRIDTEYDKHGEHGHLALKVADNGEYSLFVRQKDQTKAELKDQGEIS